MHFAYGLNPDSNDEEPRRSIDIGAFRMLRFRYLLSESKNTYQRILRELPRLSLIDRFRIITNYHEMFSVLGTTNFPVRKKSFWKASLIPRRNWPGKRAGSNCSNHPAIP